MLPSLHLVFHIVTKTPISSRTHLCLSAKYTGCLQVLEIPGIPLFNNRYYSLSDKRKL